MGFPVGYTEAFLPKLFLHALSLLSLLRSFSVSLLRAAGFSAAADHPTHQPPASFPPLSALLIRERLPAVKFSDALAGGAAAGSCAVCLCQLEGDEEVRWPINCRHVFHRSCLDRWMDHDQRTCPLCRAHLLGGDAMEEFNQRLVSADEYYYHHDDFQEHDDYGDQIQWSSHY